MFNIGPQELLLILLVALIVVGPKRLPELSRSIGRGLRELRKAQDEVRRTIDLSLDESEPTAPKAAAGAVGTTEGASAAPQQPSASPAVEDETESVARTLGRGLAEIRRARQEVQRSFRVDAPDRTPPPAARQVPSARPPEGPGSAAGAPGPAEVETAEPPREDVTPPAPSEPGPAG
jgi:Tat protein translocase TatB subunit